MGSERTIVDFLTLEPTVEFLGMAENVHGVSPRPLFDSINRYDATPTATLSIYAPPPSRDRWLSDQLASVGSADIYHLWLLDFSPDGRWASVRVPEGRDWFLALLEQHQAARGELSDMVVLPDERACFFGVIVDEWKYLAFSRPIVGPDAG